MCFSHWFHAGSFGRHWKNYGWRQSIQGSGVGRQLLTLSNWSTLNTVQLWRLKSHCVTLAQNSAVSLVAIVTFRCYWFGEILEMKHCKGWWVGHPAQSQPLVVLESKDSTLFNIWSVLLSKCYLILHSSLKLFGHSSSRIASENWDPFQEVVSSSMPPHPAESVESYECGSDWIFNHQLHVPMLRPGGGEGLHPSCWDLWASRAGWPRAGSVLGDGPGVPPTPVSLATAEIHRGWGWTCLQGCLEKILRNSFILQNYMKTFSAGRTPWIFQEGTFLLHK